MTPNQKMQKNRARKESEYHANNSNVIEMNKPPADAGSQRSLDTLAKEGYKFGFNGEITRNGTKL